MLINYHHVSSPHACFWLTPLCSGGFGIWWWFLMFLDVASSSNISRIGSWRDPSGNSHLHRSQRGWPHFASGAWTSWAHWSAPRSNRGLHPQKAVGWQHPEESEEARLTGHQALIGQIFGWPTTTGYVWKACKTLRFGVLMALWPKAAFLVEAPGRARWHNGAQPCLALFQWHPGPLAATMQSCQEAIGKVTPQVRLISLDGDQYVAVWIGNSRLTMTIKFIVLHFTGLALKWYTTLHPTPARVFQPR